MRFDLAHLSQRYYLLAVPGFQRGSELPFLILAPKMLASRLVFKILSIPAMQASTKLVLGTTSFFTLDPFCFKQFKVHSTKGNIDYDPEEFTKKIETFYQEHPDSLKPGYAPFCKHLFIPNFTKTAPGTVPLSAEVSKLVKTDYEARMEYELPVLVRWVSKEDLPSLPPAKFLDIILYSKEQVLKENAAGGRTDPN